MKNLERIKRLICKKLGRFIKLCNLDIMLAKLGVFYPKVIVKMDGGLASQMNFFAVGYSVAKKTNLPLFFDVTWYEEDGKDNNGLKNRGFNLFNAFPLIREKYGNCLITKKDISSLFTNLFRASYYKRGVTDYTPELFDNRSVYLDGYYANVRYLLDVQPDLCQLMQFKQTLSDVDQCIQHEIHNCTSCALHIRRGDYCGTVHEVCTPQYYVKAIERMLELHPDVVFFVFSNDENWTEKFLGQLSERIKYVMLRDRDEASPISDMQLMAECKHAIISNSGFSHFPAFLTYSEQKNVIMPDIWFGDKLNVDSRDLYFLPGWIRIPVR